MINCYVCSVLILATHHFVIISSESGELSSLKCKVIPENDNCTRILSGKYYAPNTVDTGIFTLIRQSNILDSVKDNEPCTIFYNGILCFYNFPPCDPDTSQLLPFCPERCEELRRLLEFCGELIDFLILNFNCSNPATYFGTLPVEVSVSTTTCSNVSHITLLPLLNEANVTEVGTSKDKSDASTGITVAVSVGGTGFIIIVAIIVCVMCLKTKSKRKSGKMVKVFSMQDPYEFSRYLDVEGNCKWKSGYDHKHKESTADINQLLQHVETKFSDVLIPAQQIVTQEYLGKGAFGVVHKGELKDVDGAVSPVAIKTIKCSVSLGVLSTIAVLSLVVFSLSSMAGLVAEIATMKIFDHPNVLKLLGVCVDTNDDDMLKVVLPYMANGDLRNFLKQRRVDSANISEFPTDIDEKLFLKMCLDIAKGMEYLTGKRFVHRDLAARNCMVDDDYNIKVADFGLTRDVYASEYYKSDKPTILPVKWMSPESLMDHFFDEKTDVWSYGITCWEIFSLGSTPYPGVDNTEMITFLEAGKRLKRPVLCPEELFALIQTTWLENASERPSFATIVTTLSQGCEEIEIVEKTSAVL